MRQLNQSIAAVRSEQPLAYDNFATFAALHTELVGGTGDTTNATVLALLHDLMLSKLLGHSNTPLLVSRPRVSLSDSHANLLETLRALQAAEIPVLLTSTKSVTELGLDGIADLNEVQKLIIALSEAVKEAQIAKKRYTASAMFDKLNMDEARLEKSIGTLNRRVESALAALRAYLGGCADARIVLDKPGGVDLKVFEMPV